MAINKYTVSEANNLSLGQAGLDVIVTGDPAETGNWVAVKAFNIASQAGGVTKYSVVFDHSGGSTW